MYIYIHILKAMMKLVTAMRIHWIISTTLRFGNPNAAVGTPAGYTEGEEQLVCHVGLVKGNCSSWRNSLSYSGICFAWDLVCSSLHLKFLGCFSSIALGGKGNVTCCDDCDNAVLRDQHKHCGKQSYFDDRTQLWNDTWWLACNWLGLLKQPLSIWLVLLSARSVKSILERFLEQLFSATILCSSEIIQSGAPFVSPSDVSYFWVQLLVHVMSTTNPSHWTDRCPSFFVVRSVRAETRPNQFWFSKLGSKTSRKHVLLMDSCPKNYVELSVSSSGGSPVQIIHPNWLVVWLPSILFSH